MTVKLYIDELTRRGDMGYVTLENRLEGILGNLALKSQRKFYVFHLFLFLMFCNLPKLKCGSPDEENFVGIRGIAKHGADAVENYCEASIGAITK